MMSRIRLPAVIVVVGSHTAPTAKVFANDADVSTKAAVRLIVMRRQL